MHFFGWCGTDDGVKKAFARVLFNWFLRKELIEELRSDSQMDRMALLMRQKELDTFAKIVEKELF